MKLKKWEIEDAVNFVKDWMKWVEEHGPYAPCYYYEKLFKNLERIIETVKEES